MTSWWRPDRFSQKRKNLEARAKIFAALRNYFAGQDFIEVDTPALQASWGADPHLHGFETVYEQPHDGASKLYLHTSPEFSCKKLLVAGMERIYQLSHVFRNREGGSRHAPEFMLLEWYRKGAGYNELMEDCMVLLRAALKAAGAKKFVYKNISCDPALKPEILSVNEAFRRFAAIDLLASIDDPQHPAPEKIAAEAKRIGVRVGEGDRFEDIVLRIMGERIEPHLGKERVCFLTDYPVSMAALARPKPSDPHLAERFELYVCGLELANAFVELTDARVQRARLEADSALREKLYGAPLPMDEDFLAALEHGMPQAAGIALGVDRLVMLTTGAENIEDVLWAPVP